MLNEPLIPLVPTIGALTVSVVMLTLSLATLMRDPRYLGNLLFAGGFLLLFLAFLLNGVYLLMDLGHSACPYLPFKLVWAIGTCSMVPILGGQLALLRGTSFVLRPRSLLLLGALVAACALVLLGEVHPPSDQAFMPSWGTSFFVITFGLGALYSSATLAIGLRVLPRLNPSTRRRYLRLELGFLLMAVTYLFLQTVLYLSPPHRQLLVALGTVGYLFGALLLYLGLIRTWTGSSPRGRLLTAPPASSPTES